MRNISKRIITGWLILLWAISTQSPVYAFSSAKTIGKVIPKASNVQVLRKGKKLSVGSFGLVLNEGDVVITDKLGKAHIALENSNDVFVGPSSRLMLSQKITKSGLSVVKKFILNIIGKLRAKVRKSKRLKVEVRTATAVIGVKGTDFIVEFVNKTTTVGTLTGLVNLSSNTTKKSIDIPKGKMSSISPFGEVMPLREIAGELLRNVEFAGEKMDEDDIGGEKLEM